MKVRVIKEFSVDDFEKAVNHFIGCVRNPKIHYSSDVVEGIRMVYTALIEYDEITKTKQFSLPLNEEARHFLKKHKDAVVMYRSKPDGYSYAKVVYKEKSGGAI